MLKRTILSILLALVTILGGTSSVFADDGGYWNQDREQNAYCVSIYRAMVSNFLTIDDNGRTYAEYPSDYAGAYIDEANNLHILLVNNAEGVYDYAELTGYDKVVIIEYADFSYNKLVEIRDVLNNAIDEYGDLGFYTEFGISGFSVNEITNVVDIGMFDRARESTVLAYLEANVEGFTPRSVVFDDGHKAEYTTTTSTQTTALAGDPAILASGAFGTIGFNAYRVKDKVTTYGIVTAGHVASVGDAVYNAYGSNLGSHTKIGTCDMSIVGHTNQGNSDSRFDVAFIPISSNAPNPSITPSSKVSNNWWNSSEEDVRGIRYDYDIVVGMETIKVGAGGTGTGTPSFGVVNSGYVLSKSYTVTVGSVYHTDQVVTSNWQVPGDSGGPVGEWVSGITGGIYLIGIATMRDANNNAIATKASNISNYLGIYPVTK
ncbi:MAG: S1 family peptidase [Dehalococcoidia bacterium]|nr:S1 family peptidase [Dehalococcoidia bacterium]